MNASPVPIASRKLIIVPIIIYSDSLRLLGFENSPNLKIDLAAIRKPTAEKLSEITKRRIKVRSSIPIIFPPLLNPLFELSISIWSRRGLTEISTKRDPKRDTRIRAESKSKKKK